MVNFENRLAYESPGMVLEGDRGGWARTCGFYSSGGFSQSGERRKPVKRMDPSTQGRSGQDLLAISSFGLCWSTGFHPNWSTGFHRRWSTHFRPNWAMMLVKLLHLRHTSTSGDNGAGREYARQEEGDHGYSRNAETFAARTEQPSGSQVDGHGPQAGCRPGQGDLASYLERGIATTARLVFHPLTNGAPVAPGCRRAITAFCRFCGGFPTQSRHEEAGISGLNIPVLERFLSEPTLAQD